jgi:putative membrane protein
MMSLADLPVVNATLNGCSALFLATGYVLVRRGRPEAHRSFMLAALVASTLFLVCYLTYHGYLAYVLHRGPTRFLEPKWFRPIYLTILLTHTILAVVILPLILVTLVWAMRGRFDKHRAIARWTWPLWMYVSVTGVAIYLLLYRVFPQPL